MRNSVALRKIQEVIEQHGWTRGSGARRKDGHECDPTSPAATKFCFWGAADKAGVTDDIIVGSLSSVLFGKDILDFNDELCKSKDDFLFATDFLRYAAQDQERANQR
jgi:hypothetical protein